MFGTNPVRIAIWTQPRPGLIPDEIALRDEPDRRSSGRQVRPGEDVATALVRVPDDENRVAARSKDALDLPKRVCHPIEERGIVGQVREVGGVVGDHRVVGPPVRERLGELAARHRHR